MNNIKKVILSSILCISIILSGCSSKVDTKNINDNKESQTVLKVSFFDVDQADCSLIQSKNMNILIDSGNNQHEQKVVNHLNKNNVKELDYFILTHKDADHIGGADKVIENFKVKNVIMTKEEKTQKLIKMY